MKILPSLSDLPRLAKFVLLVICVVVLLIEGVVLIRAREQQIIQDVRKAAELQHKADLERNARLRQDMVVRIRQGIEKGVGEYAAHLDAEEAARVVDDKLARQNIEKLIIADPNLYTNQSCVVPPEMLAERNRIRLNGK